MNYGPLLFLGVLVSFVLSWSAMVAVPFRQLSGLETEVLPASGMHYPGRKPGLAQQGREVYRAQGCQYCHTQQVRGSGYGQDIARGWGMRASVGQDFLFENPVMLGNVRFGQDLANVGNRRTNATWHFQHLYAPKSLVPGSLMPKYAHLFEKRPLTEAAKSEDAIEFRDEKNPEQSYAIVPKPEARALVAYLLSLDANVGIFAAPIPAPLKSATNSVSVEASAGQAP